MYAVNLVILVTIIAKCYSISIVEADRIPKAVAVLYRHGDRAPIFSYPNDPYFDRKYWPDGYGQLLKTGKARQYQLGVYLRKRYANFLSTEYSRDEIYVRSSDIDRTLTSAASNLAGLYSRDKDEIFNENLNWIPIPIHTVPRNEDAVILMGTYCPKYSQLLEEISKVQYNEFIEEDAEIIEIVSNATTIPKDEINFGMLYGDFYCYQKTNASYLPQWYSSLNQTVFENFAGRQFARENTTELKRLGTGPFITYLTNYFDNAMNGSAPKLLMLSGHDTTITAVLNAMEVYDYKLPEFASMVIWELYQESDGNYTMEVFYKRNSESEADKLNVTEGAQEGNYEAFKQFLEPLIIDDETRTEECRILPNSSSSISLSLINVFILLFVLSSF